MRLMVVEDPDDNARTLAAWLRLDGHEVETFGTADDAIRRLDGPPADAAVIDVRLPSRDGTWVLRAMRVVASAWAFVPVVMVSGVPKDLPDDFPLDGPTVRLEKPFEPLALLDAIRRAGDIIPRERG